MLVFSKVRGGFRRNGRSFIEKGENRLPDSLSRSERALLRALVKSKLVTVIDQEPTTTTNPLAPSPSVVAPAPVAVPAAPVEPPDVVEPTPTEDSTEKPLPGPMPAAPEAPPAIPAPINPLPVPAPTPEPAELPAPPFVPAPRPDIAPPAPPSTIPAQSDKGKHKPPKKTARART